jgi:hypothetical protein
LGFAIWLCFAHWLTEICQIVLAIKLFVSAAGLIVPRTVLSGRRLGSGLFCNWRRWHRFGCGRCKTVILGDDQRYNGRDAQHYHYALLDIVHGFPNLLRVDSF